MQNYKDLLKKQKKQPTQQNKQNQTTTINKKPYSYHLGYFPDLFCGDTSRENSPVGNFFVFSRATNSS